MSPGGGILSRAHVLGIALCCAVTGCVREAVLENQLAIARDRERALAQASDLKVAEAALSMQLIELEALLLQRAAHREQELLELLHRGYSLLAQGFIEARRLEAVAAGETARAETERRLRDDAQARATEYRRLAGPVVNAEPARRELQHEFLLAADAACRTQNATGYERELSAVLARVPSSPGQRLRLALAQRLAAAWLLPPIAKRCGFTAPPVPPRAPG